MLLNIRFYNEQDRVNGQKLLEARGFDVFSGAGVHLVLDVEGERDVELVTEYLHDDADEAIDWRDMDY